MKNIPLEFRGTPLSENDFAEHHILFSFDTLNGQFGWDTGIAIGKYLEGLKNGVIYGVYCASCRKIMVPPRVVCEWCYRPTIQYIPLEDSGTVNTFSICYVTWDVQRLKIPVIPAVIDLDSASPNHGILHKLGEISPDDVKIGMRVKAVWKPAKKRIGAITDIEYFKPIKE
ncbi:MAG: Zn-ribbon domain-containing OB-fold protein [Anaerolineaceae bacterium]